MYFSCSLKEAHKPIRSLDSSTSGIVGCEKIEACWRVIDGNGQICIDLKRSIMRDTGHYVDRVFNNEHRLDSHISWAVDAGILRCRTTCSVAEKYKGRVEQTMK